MKNPKTGKDAFIAIDGERVKPYGQKPLNIQSLPRLHQGMFHAPEPGWYLIESSQHGNEPPEVTVTKIEDSTLPAPKKSR